MYMNLNTDFDNDYTVACELMSKNFSHEDLISMLKNGNLQEKQFAAMRLDAVNNNIEREILINSLTGCDGKIREAAALKINQLLTANADSFIQNISSYGEVFAAASIDINANICRLVIDSASILKRNKHFSDVYLSRILKYIDEAYAAIDKFVFRDKKYVINKQMFKLYWCLEALKHFVNDIEPGTLLRILERASVEREYTIREKAAQILNLTDTDKYHLIREKLRNDENYYVRAALRTNRVN